MIGAQPLPLGATLMWLNILFGLSAWFVGALALGVLTGKSMALGNRPLEDGPDDLREELEASLSRLRDALEVDETHPVEETLLADLHPLKH